MAGLFERFLRAGLGVTPVLRDPEGLGRVGVSRIDRGLMSHVGDRHDLVQLRVRLSCRRVG
eukprot:5399751-Amphidinium_carterae.1